MLYCYVSCFILICLNLIIGIISLSLHLFSLILIVLIHPLPDIFKSMILSPILKHNGLSLRLHLLSKQFILFLFELTLHFLFSSLFLLLFKNFPFLLVRHPLPMIGFNPISIQLRLASFLNIIKELLYFKYRSHAP